MELLIRDAVKSDMESVHRLITELAVFEREPDAVEVTIADLERDGFGSSPSFYCFIAEAYGVVVGIALVYWRYSTWKGPIIHLEDLIVTNSMRGKGIGKALLKRVVEYGVQKKVRRIAWEVLDWNEPAITFYEECGATVLKDWNVVQMNKTAMVNFLKT